MREPVILLALHVCPGPDIVAARSVAAYSMKAEIQDYIVRLTEVYRPDGPAQRARYLGQPLSPSTRAILDEFECRLNTSGEPDDFAFIVRLFRLVPPHTLLSLKSLLPCLQFEVANALFGPAASSLYASLLPGFPKPPAQDFLLHDQVVVRLLFQIPTITGRWVRSHQVEGEDILQSILLMLVIAEVRCCEPCGRRTCTD